MIGISQITQSANKSHVLANQLIHQATFSYLELRIGDITCSHSQCQSLCYIIPAFYRPYFLVVKFAVKNIFIYPFTAFV